MFHFYGVLNLYNLRDLQFRIIEHINNGAVVHLYHGSCQILVKMYFGWYFCRPSFSNILIAWNGHSGGR